MLAAIELLSIYPSAILEEIAPGKKECKAELISGLILIPRGYTNAFKGWMVIEHSVIDPNIGIIFLDECAASVMSEVQPFIGITYFSWKVLTFLILFRRSVFIKTDYKFCRRLPCLLVTRFEDIETLIFHQETKICWSWPKAWGLYFSRYASRCCSLVIHFVIMTHVFWGEV